MNHWYRNTRGRRIWTCVLVLALVSTSFLDVNFQNGKLRAGTKVQAATGTIEETALLDSEVVPDATLLAYLRETILAAMKEKGETPKDVSAITYRDVQEYLTSDLTIPAGVQDITGLGWARRVRSIDLSSCTDSKLTEIPAGEFNECTSLETIKLPANITKIGEESFNGCSNLTTINLENLNSIGANAFNGCKVLSDTSVASLPDALNELGVGVFKGCTALTTLKVPTITGASGKNTVPRSYAEGCKNLSEVTLCDSSALKEIQESAFADTGKLAFKLGVSGSSSDKLPSSVSVIGISAFQGSQIADLDLTDTAVNVINENVFNGADLSVNFKFPAGTVEIKKQAFQKSKIKVVDMPESVTTLGEQAFYLAQCLTDLKLSVNIKTIPVAAFQGAGNGSVIISNTTYSQSDSGDKLTVSFSNEKEAADSQLETIGASAFDCAAISDDDFLSGLTKLKELGANAFSSTDFKKLTIPKSVETLGEAVFNACSSLQTVTFESGSGVKELPENCFGSLTAPKKVNDVMCVFSCINLEKVVLPETLVSIGENCFANCYALTTTYAGETTAQDNVISFPSTLETIGTKAFYKASYHDYSGDSGTTYGDLVIFNGGIESVVLPDSVTEIGEYAFAENVMLKSIQFGKGLKELPKGICYGCGKFPEVKTDETSSTKPTADTEAKHYDEMEDTYTPIKDFLGLKTVILPNTVEKIGDSAFEKCYALTMTSGYLPTNLTTIGSKAFYQCKSLSEIYFNSELTTIGDSAFAEAAQQVSVKTDKTGKTSITREFSGLSTLNFTSATHLKTIGTSAFAKTNISTISIPETVTVIPATICDSCYNLESVSIATTDSSATIGARAFQNCYMLRSVKLPYSATWDTTLFSGYTSSGASGLTISPSGGAEEDVSAIYGRANDLPLKCLDKFATDSTLSKNLTLTVKDAGKNDDDTTGILYNTDGTQDNNEFLSIGVDSKNKIQVNGKKEGTAKIKVIGTINLYAMGKTENSSLSAVTLTQVYNVNVTGLPVATLSIKDVKDSSKANTNIIKEGGKDTLYLSLADTSSGKTLYGIYTPYNPTETITWSSGTDGIIQIGEPSVTSVEKLNEGYSQVSIKANTTETVGDTVLKASTPSESAECVVKVRVPASGITLNTNSISISPDDTYDLSATMTFDKKYDSYTAEQKDVLRYTSSDESIAIVDYDTGRIVAKAEGKAKITVKALASGRTTTCNVTVMGQTPVESLAFDYSKFVTENNTNVLYMEAGSTSAITLPVTYAPAETTSVVSCSLDKPDVVTMTSAEKPSMSNGKCSVIVKAANPGDATLTVKAGDKEVKCIIRVRAYAKNVTLSSESDKSVTSKTVATGDTLQLYPTFTYADDYTSLAEEYKEGYTYSSANEEVATVDQNGLITTKKAGTARIILKTNVSGRTATFSVTVKDGYNTDTTNKNTNTSDGKTSSNTSTSSANDKNAANGTTANGTTANGTTADGSTATSQSKPGKAKIKAKNKKKKSIKVTWKKVSGASGYEVSYSLNKKFKKAKKKTTTKTSYTIKKLKKKKTYYVRVRAYKTVNGKKLYGGWSSAKKVKIKK